MNKQCGADAGSYVDCGKPIEADDVVSLALKE